MPDATSAAEPSFWSSASDRAAVRAASASRSRSRSCSSSRIRSISASASKTAACASSYASSRSVSALGSASASASTRASSAAAASRRRRRRRRARSAWRSTSPRTAASFDAAVSARPASAESSRSYAAHAGALRGDLLVDHVELGAPRGSPRSPFEGGCRVADGLREVVEPAGASSIMARVTLGAASVASTGR